jgi:hypothetical protein
MALNFNVDPYYDDFDPAKNFHRILFKPGRAVQARELTQSQTILQDQITKFADNIFKQNSPVSGGQVTTNFNCYYIKLQETFNGSSVDASLWDGLLITNNIGTVTARVIKTVQATGGDPPTLIVTYKSGVRFGDNDLIYDVNSTKTVQAVVSNSTGYSSVASIAQGVFYVLGNFVQVNPATIVLEKYGNVVSKRIGLEITETIYDYANDASMLDPAVGASNYQAPGADRYVIKLDLTSRPIYFGDDQYFIELVRVEDGSIFKMVDGSVYNVIDDYFAKRDYETNGDYVVEDFKLTPKTNPNDTNTYLMSVGKGLAYVRGYRTLNPSPINITTNRARTIGTQNTETIFVDYGSYFYVSNVRGANASTFDITTSNTVDFHCVTTSNVNVTSATTYNSTLVATGYIRGLTYDHSITNSQANTYTYKAFVYDLQNNVLTGNVVSSTSTTVTLPSTASSVDGAYVGVNISITKGTDAGEQRTISSYVGSTKVATLTNSWGVNPDATSVFVLNFDTKDVESMMYASKSAYPATIYGTAAIDNTGKVNGLSSGDTIFENPTVPEMIYRIGNPYVSGVVNPSYTTSQEFRNVTFGVSGTTLTAQLSYAGDYSGVLTHIGNDGTLSSDVVKQSFTIIVTNKGTNTTINNGDIINWVTGSRVVTISGSGSVATFTTNTSDLTAFTATVIAKVSVINAGDTNHILKVKKLITANTQQIKLDGTQVNTYTFVDDTTNSTGQIYINAAGVVSPGTKQSIYLSDVKRIVKIIDTKSSGTPPILSMLTNSTYDVTSNFIFDNGQRDSYYDHASITLRPGAPKPAGNLLVLVDYYQHSGGDGYFSKMSYIDLSSSPEDYRQIPNYVSKNGVNYSLRDCLDFRPARLNAQTSFVYRYSNPGDSKVGVFLPVDLTTFTTTYSYYLARKDKLVLTKDSTLQIIEGSPSLSPIFPSTPDGSLVLAELTHNPYTGYLPTEAQTGFLGDLSIEKVQHRRYTMSDIAGLDTRINRVEYYTALNSLEQNANSLQISDAYGLNRFKNGIMVDDFSGFSASETGSSDFSANINRRTRKMTSSQNVFNFPLKALALAYNMNSPSSSAISGLNYKITTDGVVNYFSLPYTTKNLVSQKLASRTVNVNPFSVSSAKGVVSLSPNVDNWVDTTKSPSLLITDPDLQVFQANGGTNNVLSYGDWQAVTGTPVLTGQSQSQTSSVGQPVVNHGRFNGPSGNIPGFEATYVTTTVTSTYDMRGTERQNTILGPYNSINNTYSMDNGYITDVSILSWIRPQQIIVRADGMLTNTTLNAQFDNVDVKNYIRKSNSIELESVSGTFKEGDVIGYYSSGSFNPTGTVIGVHKYSGSTNVRLYVAGDGKPTTYNNGLTLQNAFFDVSGNYQNATATGSVTSTKHYGGLIKGVASNTVTLSQLASTTNNFYTGQTIYINAGSGIGQSATITGYVGSTRVATLSTTLSCSINDIYSIGTFVTDEQGRFYGIFTIPPGTFHTGQRVFRFDNAINGNIGSVTTYSEGTFFSEGLQVNKQKIDFGASPSGAKDTFTQTNDRSYSRSMDPTVEVFTDTYYTPLDPVAQTFIIDPNNFPNGAFLDSAKFFFASKPASDTAPIRLSIVGTLNGYPNGSTLDHSIVTLTPQQVNVSDSPQYLDSTAYTEFKFSTPVYIQPGVLYSFILKSNSNEYTLWTAANGDTALSSSVKNLPTDAIPSTITKISTAPYVGGLFISQNSQTWSVDQNQSLMFTIERCSFDTTQTPTVRMVIPKKLPQRTLVDSSIDYYSNANNFTDIVGVTTNSDILVDAFNVTTTDFIPTSTSINYNYDATLQSGTSAGQVNINPGKYGSTMIDHLYLNDNKGERILQANSTTSFSLYAQMSSNNDAVSPILSDAGTTAYAIQYNINNCELSNNLITLVSGGSGYNVACTSVTVSAPTGKNGVQAYAAANISGGIVQSVYLTSVGSGYIETPRITITDANTTPGTGATVTVTGETSSSGGPAATRYMTKKVVLDAGFDSGDLQVYMTAYRPVGTDINVYYKVLNRNDTQNFDQGYWQLMTKVNSSDSTYSQTRNDLYEFTFAPGSLSLGRDQGYISYQSTNGQTYTNFSQFALKIVLTTTDKTNVPTLSDMRCVALPANINTVA